MPVYDLPAIDSIIGNILHRLETDLDFNQPKSDISTTAKAVRSLPTNLENQELTMLALGGGDVRERRGLAGRNDPLDSESLSPEQLGRTPRLPNGEGRRRD